jgi:hypothetical protein
MKTKKLITQIENARFAATLERASFDHILARGDSLATFMDGSPVTENRVTEFIKERVDLHHRSWIIGPLDTALQIIKEDKR